MIKNSVLLCALFLFSLPMASQATLPAMVDGQPLPSLAPVLEQVTPSVVNIYTQTRVRINNPLINDPFFRRFFNIPDQPQERVSQSLGSGVIVDADEGYVLTNNHVISGADEISVTLADGRSFQAEVIGTDPDTDLAMVQIPAENLRALIMADSNDLRVGDFVVAVGNPFGLGQTVTSGIVSALGRAGFRGLEFQNFIQTDASINPGNSGGALVNLRGELVGINSAIFTPSGGNIGIGFAIPTAMASHVMRQLAEYGEVRRGTLGLYVQDLTPELAGALGIENTKGALVAEVIKGAAADKAGIEAGDVIIEVADYPVHSMQDFYVLEGQLPVGDKKPLKYLRDGKSRTARLGVSELPVLAGGDLDRRFAGATFEELPAKMRAEQLRGVILSELERQSRLARSGLRPGDIVTAVNRQPIQGLGDFEDLVKKAQGPLLLQLWRNGGDYVARID
jgi:Do/DeqQ family serine protease